MNKKASLTVIFLTVFIDLLGFGILIPILPTFASKELGIGDFPIQILIGTYSLMQFLFNPVMGQLSDKFGRRPFILLPLFMTGVSYIIFALSHSYWMLLVSRIIAGIGGSNIGVAQAYIADITPHHERSKGMGLIGAAFGLGFVFGPVIGGFLAHQFGYQYAGFGSAAFSFTAFIFAAIVLRESNTNKKNHIKIKYKIFDFGLAKKVLKHPQIGLLVFLFSVIVFSIANIYGTFTLLGFKYYKFTDSEIGYLYGIMGVATALMQGVFIRHLAKRFRDNKLVYYGTFIKACALILIPYGINFFGIALLLIMLSFGSGILQPTLLSMISKYAPPDEQGSILGFSQSLASLARVLGPIWGGIAFDYIGYEFPFITGGLFTFFAFVVSLFLMKSEKFQESS